MSARYNFLVTFRPSYLLMLALVSCSTKPAQTQDAVRQAVVDHLAKRSDMLGSSMTISVVSVNFRGDEADAVVSVAPKEGGSGIQMTYTLATENGKWAVKKSGAPSGAPHQATPPAGELPAGHPPVGGAPKGHP
jgi:hypothetical protein